MAYEIFKEKYKKAKVWADLDEAMKELTPNECKELHKSLEVTKKATGLDMRQDFLLGLLR